MNGLTIPPDKTAQSNHPCSFQFRPREELPKLWTERLRSFLPGVFGELSNKVTEELLNHFRWCFLSRGESLFEQGEAGDSLYFMGSGRLRVVVGSGEQRKAVAELSQGSCLGEMALLSGERRSASVYAARDSMLARLDRESFDRFAESEPQLIRGLATVLAERIRLKDKEAYKQQHLRISTIAVVPLSEEIDTEDFCERLLQALACHGTIRKIDENDFKNATEASNDNELGWLYYLANLEGAQRFTIFQTASRSSPWSKLAVRAADKVLLLDDRDGSPELKDFEPALFQGMQAGTEVDRELILLHEDGSKLPRGTAHWLDCRPEINFHHHIRLNRNSDFERLGRFLAGCAIGVVLSGGGARTAAHVGALTAIEELNIPIDILVGTSGGGALCAQYALGFDPRTKILELGEELWVRDNHLKPTVPILSFLNHKAVDQASKKVNANADVRDSWLPYACLACNLTLGKGELIRTGPMWKANRATTAIPGVFVPMFKENGELLVDGGVIDNLPVKYMRQLNQGPIIVINAGVSEELKAVYEYNALPTWWQVLWSWINPFKKAITVPSALEIVSAAAMAQSVDQSQMETGTINLALEIPAEKIGMLDFSQTPELIALGRSHTLEHLGAWWDKEYPDLLGQEQDAQA